MKRQTEDRAERRDPLVVTDVQFTPASWAQQQTGLLGYLKFGVGGGLVIDSVTLRRTLEGKLTLSFPRRKNRFPVRPSDEGARRSIERQVLAQLDLDGGGAQ